MEEVTKDVVIIGAGLAGLAAGLRLQERVPGLDVAVLEAGDRVGGRTLSLKVNGPEGEDTFDLGAHWIGSKQREIMDLVKRFGIEYYRQNVTGKKIMQVGEGNVIRTYTSDIPRIGSWLALVEMQFLVNKVERLCSMVDIRDPYSSPLAHELDGMTAESLVRRETRFAAVRDVFNAAMQASMGCDVGQISALHFLAYANAAGGVMKVYLTEEGSAQEFRVKGGTQQICHNLAKLLGKEKIALDHRVTSISMTDRTATVTCADGVVYSAKRVILTVPPPHMAKIHFDPPLHPARLSLIMSMPMGNLVKIFVFYEEAFWLAAGFSGESVSNGGNGSGDALCENGPVTITLDATTSQGTPALVCFMAGRNADQWLAKSESERKMAVTDQLRNYFGPQAKSPIRYVERVWASDSLFGGGPVCICSPGSMHNFHLLRQPHHLVHVAGTDLATEWTGFMSGAVQSGYRAAAEVILELGEKAKLTKEDEELLNSSGYKKSTKAYGKISRITLEQSEAFSTTQKVAMLVGACAVAYVFRKHIEKAVTSFSRPSKG